MALKQLKDTIRKTTDPLEAAILANDYFPLQKSLNYPDKVNLIWKDLRFRVYPRSIDVKSEITFLLYSKACERLLVPLILNLLNQSEVKERGIQINVVVLFGIHRLQLSSDNLQQLHKLGCQIQTDYFSLIRACHQPQQKLVVLCLDHRKPYIYHHWGVNTVDTLKRFGVKTLSIQHGGTRADSVEDLASAASDIVLVWGKRVYREIVEKYGGNPQRFRVVGNPLHDRLAMLEHTQIRQRFINCYPEASTQLDQKRVILLASCLHSEYRGMGDEMQMYRDYIRHIYNSIDFSQILLLVKMHPLDTLEPNLYRQGIPSDQGEDSIIIIEPTVTELDIYSLLALSELLITRASTVAEEALLMRKKVISFDLLSEGPSKSYKHLEEYGSYTTVYAMPNNQLNQAISSILLEQSSDRAQQSSFIEEELTYALDGNSTNRAVNEILMYLLND
ncbi:MAG: hypothetical protein ACFE0J_16635 [Elainellaceae cyanobacterium]